MRVLITGAAGNLGGILAGHLLVRSSHGLNLMVHRTRLAPGLAETPRIKVYQCDLGRPDTLAQACRDSDVIVHFAGVLFAPGPERFLPDTNTGYTKNLVDAAVTAGVKRFILISFPHVEGPTTRENPCTGRLDGRPVNVHARTRLESERYVLEQARRAGMRGISLRAGMVYGKDILMVAFARKLAEKRLLGVWREPTPIHLIAIDDFNECCLSAIDSPGAEGIYPLGDDAPTTLQDFLDFCCRRWKTPAPWRLPLWSVYAAAWSCEAVAWVFGTRTPFTVDFIRIGRVPYCCDTSRMKSELLGELKYPSLADGARILGGS